MTYTATDIVLIIGAVSLAATGIISAWRTSSKVDVASTKIDANQETNTKKLDEIHNFTNGNLTKLSEKIDNLEKKAIIDTENVKTMQDIVKNLTTGSSVNLVDPNKK